MPDRYSDEQVETILVHAMNNLEDDGFSRNQLEEMANELGISPEALAKAESHVNATSSTPDSQTEGAYSSERSSPEQVESGQILSRNGFSQHLAIYLIVNGGLLVLNFILSGAITWAIYSVLGWGIGLVFHPRRSPTHQSPE